MKRFIICMLALVFAVLPAYAETARVFAADTDSGAILIDENGALVTGLGEYDVIDLVSYGDCPADRQLFMVSQMDLSDGFFLEEEYGVFDDWDDALDDVDNWPDTEGLDEGYDMEGYDMEIVDDIPIDEHIEDGYDDDMGEYLSSYFEPEFLDTGYGVALMNARGELLTGFDYVSFQHDVENGVVAAYSFDGFVSMLDEQGNVLTPCDYTSIVSNGNGGFIAVKPEIDGETGDLSEIAPIVLISSDGSVSETGLYTYSYETLPGYYDGYMCTPVRPADADMEGYCEYMYIDANGAPAFGERFDYASDFVDGYAEVTDFDYNTCLIDTSGRRVVSGEYLYYDLGDENDDMPFIGNLPFGGFDLISRDDYSIVASFRPETEEGTLYAHNSGDGLIVAYSDTESMLLDGDGKVLYRGSLDEYAQIWYEYADSQPQRVLLTRFDGENYSMCVAQLDGTQVSDWYSEVMALSWTEDEGRYLVLDYELIEVMYDDTVGYEPDMDTFAYGVIDQDGNVVVEMRYDYFACLAPDRYWVAQGDVYSLMDADGNVIATLQE
ncbi:MAG: WG repeat-containing protein [Clostridia bacterium]|nr:WG repeat-containing protein [Clostridia bacterium]